MYETFLSVSALQVVWRARSSAKVPPSLVVISRVRQFRIRKDQEGGFGITIRGNCPVFVRSVDFPSPARQAGLRSGDLLLEVNGKSVQFSSKLEVLELLRASGDTLTVMVIAGGLDLHPLSPSASLSPPSSMAQASHTRIRAKYQKAADFQNKVRLGCRSIRTLSGVHQSHLMFSCIGLCPVVHL